MFQGSHTDQRGYRWAFAFYVLWVRQNRCVNAIQFALTEWCYGMPESYILKPQYFWKVKEEVEYDEQIKVFDEYSTNKHGWWA